MKVAIYLRQLFLAPWKIFLELKMIFLRPFIFLTLRLKGLQIGKNYKFYGLPTFFRHQKSKITIGHHFENRNWKNSNPIGINHPTIFTTWKKNSQIKIGNHVGISGGSICAATRISIGDYTIIGSNCDIIDTDFHPLTPKNRRYSQTKIKSKPIIIGSNVFIGTQSLILKGVKIGKNSVIAAGSLVSKNIPSDSIYIKGKIKPLK